MHRPTLADRILAYMTRVPPSHQIYRRHELDVLGARTDVDRALAQLERDRKIGSPAPGIWFPLVPCTDAWGVRYLPPVQLRELAESLLQREGVTLCPSPQERDYDLYHSSLGQEGVKGVPTFEDIGVETAAPLLLLWGQGRVQTVHQEERLMPENPLAYSPVSILDPEEFRRAAGRAMTPPERLEKDIWVNCALKVLGELPFPPHGIHLFAGGTSLTKAWNMSPRFSEDIDLRFQGAEAYDRVPESVKREVHGFLQDAVQDKLVSLLPEGSVMQPASAYEHLSPVQRVYVQYRSWYVDVPRTLKLEIMFHPGQVPWIWRQVHAFPTPNPLKQDFRLASLPCVLPWVTMTGKLHAVSLMTPGASVDDMRHIVDLGIWLSREDPAAYFPYMVQLSIRESGIQNLLDGLWSNLDTLDCQPDCAVLYDAYVDRMFLGNRREDAPEFHTAIASIRALWRNMCQSDWDNPAYRMEVPPVPEGPDVLSRTDDEFPPDFGLSHLDRG